MRLLAKVAVSKTITLPKDVTVASITFDDVPDSAAIVGAPILERHGMRGTFYVAAGTCGMQDALWTVASRSLIRAIHDAGHEVACHTANHVNVQSLNRQSMILECDLNRNLLTEICGDIELTNFAYPFGDLGIKQKLILENRFATCRTIYEFVNTGRIATGRLGAIGLFDSTKDRQGLRQIISSARAKGGWLVFYSHDVSPSPTPIGTSPTLLHDTLSMLTDAGISVMTVREVIATLARPPDR